MAKRGRPAKAQTVEPTSKGWVVDHKITVDDAAKKLKQFEQEHKLQLERFYKDLAKVRHLVDLAMTKVGFIDECENIAQAAFKAGRAYGPLDKANDMLQEILEGIYSNTDFDHWEDVSDENF